MTTAFASNVLLVRGPDRRVHATEFDRCHASTFEVDEVGALLRHVRETRGPILAVLDVRAAKAMELGRALLEANADVRLVFVASEGESERLHRDLKWIRPADAQWIVLAAEQPKLLQQINEQVRLVHLRERQRTTIDKLSLRVESELTRDPTTLRRLVISERLLGSIVQHSASAIAALSLRGEILTWNGAAGELFGVPESHALGQRIQDFFSPESRGDVEASLEALVRTKQHVRREWTTRGRTCSRMVLEVVLAPVLDESGELNALSITATDATSRKNSEAHLLTQKDVLEHIVRGGRLEETLELLTHWMERFCTQEAIATVLLLENGRLKPVAGRRCPEGWSRLIDGMRIGPSEGSCGTAAYLGRRVVVADVTRDPLWAKFAGEAVRHGLHACWSTPILSSANTVLGTFAVYYRRPAEPTREELEVVDVITRTAAIAIERRQADDALLESGRKLEEHARMLEQHVAERTAKLTETIGELEAFSYSVSHDLRTPLRAMQGYAHVLLEEHASELGAEANHYLQRIYQSSERLGLLVRDVLTYSRLSKEEVGLGAVSLNEFLETLLPHIPEAQKPGVKVEVRDALPRVLAHEAYLGQVFTNLIGNALKFVRPGLAPHLRIDAQVEGSRAKVTVADNGIGISPAHHARIFELFGRIHPESAFEGTGIGLAIARKAVQRMGGTMGVESTMGAGSTFWFTLKTA